MQALSIYLHIPFCTVRCSYCAFNVYIHQNHLIEPFVQAMLHEIAMVGQAAPQELPVHTVYFGGGTPTLLAPPQFQKILSALNANFTILPNAEISTEANPDNLLSSDYLAGLRDVGINRLSVGVQSTYQQQLALFGRLHNTDTVYDAVSNARRNRFDNLNLDLIYGVPQQTMPMWEKTLADISLITPEHLSLYALGIEPKTAMAYWIEHGKLSAPDDDLAADMYETATSYLEQRGYVQYEISNWAKPGRESRHNTQYWRNQPYLGLGPGAHGYAEGVRYENVRSLRTYIERMAEDTAPQLFPLTPVVSKYHMVTRDDAISETIMMQLRLLQEGLSLPDFEAQFGVSLLDLRGDAVHRYQRQGVLEIHGERLRLTPAGRLVSNRILRDLI